MSGSKTPAAASWRGSVITSDHVEIPAIIARLREHIASTISDGSETLTYHNMQTLLINEFGDATFSRYKHVVQRELELASKVDPKSYNRIFYSPPSDDMAGATSRSRSVFGGLAGYSGNRK